MVKCAYCGSRKGKRNCPALEGPICSTCCGGHRLQEIACPSNCSWLGGLRAVFDGENSIEFNGHDWDSAVHALFDGFQSRPGFPYIAKAMSMFELESQPREFELPLFLSYASHVVRDEAGFRFVDRFVAAHGRDMPPSQVAALETLKGAKASLFRVERVSTGVGLEVLDLVDNERITVREFSLSSQLGKGALLFAWVMSRGDHLEFTGGVAVIPPLLHEAVKTEVIHQVEKRRRTELGDRAIDLVGEVAWSVARTLRDPEAREDVGLVNTEGEDIVMSTAHYDHSDRQEVQVALTGCPDLEPSDSGFEWLDNTDAGRPLHLGHIDVDSDKLSLTTNSCERLERGKHMLEEMLGRLISHRADAFESPFGMSGDDGDADSSDSSLDLVSEDEHLEVVGNAMRAHYETWADTPLPAFNGRTPREAARTPDGRDEVSELLDDIEFRTRHMPGGAAVDFGTIRDDLGLDDDLLNNLTPYNASEAPRPEEWLELDESLRLTLVERHHRHVDEPHPVPDNSRMHALIHVAIENQIADNNPPEAAAAIDRLRNEGLTRHEALHAAGSVVAGAIWGIMQGKKEVDNKSMARQLAELTSEKWLDSTAD